MSLTGSLPEVRKFTVDDVYHYTVENRVAEDLEARDNSIAARVDTLSSHDLQVPATGFSIVMENNVKRLIIDPVAALASGTVQLPSSPYDSFSVTIVSTYNVTSLTLNAYSGHTIKNSVSSLTAGLSVSYVFSETNNTWYRT